MSLYKDQTEAELLTLVKQGSYAAFTEVYSRHWDVLFGSAYNILRDRDACMDLVQDIFVWFWENRQQWELSSSRGYLLTAVKFKTANYIRNARSRGIVIRELAVRETDHNESQALEVKQLEAFIKNISDHLPDCCREIFQLSRYDYLSNKEIAVKLEISEKTVESQITIALKRLREKLRLSHMASLFFL